MAVLTRPGGWAVSRVALVLLACAACYDPTLRDCTVACSGSGDCATGQSCRAGFCVATDDPGPACGSDLGAVASLHVMVMGPGQVTVDATWTCTSDCMYEVAAGVPHELAATAVGGHKFQMWSGGCSGAAATCTVMLPDPMAMPEPADSVAARFGG